MHWHHPLGKLQLLVHEKKISLTDFSLQGVSDKYSWIPGIFKTEGSALLWDDNFAKKPAYTSFLNVLNGQAVSSK